MFNTGFPVDGEKCLRMALYMGALFLLASLALVVVLFL